jgi:hypothetical protein
MRKDGKQIDAEVRGHGEWGWECQFIHDGHSPYGRVWNLRADALAEADEMRLELEREGWQQL